MRDPKHSPKMNSKAPNHTGLHAARRVAVLVRTHVVDAKLFDLLACLSGGRGFDLYVAANETSGPLRVGPYQKISHTVNDICALGFELPDELSLLHYSDQVFYFLQQQVPDYDFYFLIENDVHLARADGSFMEALVEKIAAGPYRDVDLVGATISVRGPDWDWYHDCKRVFRDVYGVFFPVVGLSKRALLVLHRRRLRERSESHPGQRSVYCEAFVPSALAETGRYRVADLKDIIPGCYSARSYRLNTEPFFLEDAHAESPEIELLHPVYTAWDFLERRFGKAYWNRTLDHFLEDLKHQWPAIPANVRRSFLARVDECLVKDWFASQLKEAERLKEDYFEPELVRLKAQVLEAERLSRDRLQPELERRMAELTEVNSMEGQSSEPERERVREPDGLGRDGLQLSASVEHGPAKDPTKRVAVMVRTHVVDAKVLDLLGSLAHGCSYDLYVAANETNGQLDLGCYRKISHTLDHIRFLGFDLADERAMLHYSDQLFFFLQKQVPDYDFYILVESDVHFTRNGSQFLDALAQKLASPDFGDADLLSTKCSWGWHESGWYPAAKEAFKEVHSIFFPFVGLSKRSILQLHTRRQRERADGRHPVYCEMFVPSALVEAGGFRIVDLNEMFPGCYGEESFGFNVLPQITEEARGENSTIELLHPVYTAREFLERRYSLSHWGRTLDEFLEELGHKWPTVSPELRWEFIERVESALNSPRAVAAE